MCSQYLVFLFPMLWPWKVTGGETFHPTHQSPIKLWILTGKLALTTAVTPQTKPRAMLLFYQFNNWTYSKTTCSKSSINGHLYKKETWKQRQSISILKRSFLQRTKNIGLTGVMEVPLQLRKCRKKREMRNTFLNQTKQHGTYYFVPNFNNPLPLNNFSNLQILFQTPLLWFTVSQAPLMCGGGNWKGGKCPCLILIL